MEQDFLPKIAVDQFEEMIDGLMTQEYGLCEHFLDAELLKGLRQNLLNFHRQGEMHPAGVGRKFDFQRNAEIRGDVIRWIDQNSDDPFERALMDKIAAFVAHLNGTCYTSINAWEFHYAFYEQGSFYKRHLDQFKSDRGRKYSLVMYLNEDWQEADGGHIGLFTERETVQIAPLGGRAVFFKSDELEHEVCVSPTRFRMSVAGWLKSL